MNESLGDVELAVGTVLCFIDDPGILAGYQVHQGAEAFLGLVGDGEPSLVYTETDYMIQEVSDTEEVNNYIEAFDRTVDAALEPADTTIYLKQFAERLE